MTPTSQYGWRRSGFQMPLSGSFRGFGDTTQQGAAKQVGASLAQMADAANKAGVPIAAAALEVGAALANIVALFGPNPNNTITTEWVNQMEADVMKPNLATWQSLAPQDKTPQAQQFALQVFTQGWNQIVGLCSNPQLGSAGSNCLRDRQRGGKWDWWGYYYDPIAKDPAVAANVAAAQAAAQNSTVSSSSTFLYGGLALLGLALAFGLIGGE